MNGCYDCGWAVWKKTTNGRLHPDKGGRCGFVWVPPPVPKAFSFGWQMKRGEVPAPSGGFIERRADECEGCPCFKQKDA